MDKNVKTCSCCGAEMESLASGILQLRKGGWAPGRLADLAARELEVEALRCPHCGQLAFFDADFVPKDPDQEEND